MVSRRRGACCAGEEEAREFSEVERTISGGEGGAGRMERFTVERFVARGEVGWPLIEEEIVRWRVGRGVIEGEEVRGGVGRLRRKSGEAAGGGEIEPREGEGTRGEETRLGVERRRFGEEVKAGLGEPDRGPPRSAEGIAGREGIGERIPG